MLAIRRLFLKSAPIDRPAIQTRRRAGFQPRHGQVCAAKLRSEPRRRILSNPAAFEPFLTTEQHPAQKCAGTEHNAFGIERGFVGKLEASHPIPFKDQRRRFALDQGEIGLRLHNFLHSGFEQLPVRLNARAPYGAAL